jgi:phosphoglycolate phosphatase
MTRVDSVKKMATNTASFSRTTLSGLSVCFDLDGTLVDTAPDLVRVTNEVIATEGLPETHYKLARSVVGFGSRRLISDALARAEHAVSDSRLDEMQADFLKRYADDIARHSNPYAGVIDTLRTLKSFGASLSVCTNKPGWLARPLLEALAMTHWFDTIVGGDEAPRAKPDPRHVYMAAGHRKSERIVMVGDSLPDMDAAQRAGAYAVLMTHGYSHSPQIRLRADARLRNFRSLTPALISRFGSELSH